MSELLNMADPGLVQQALDDWRFILDEYRKSHKLGLAAMAGKNDRCGLCAAHRKVARDAGGRYALSCRTCPVVKAWRRSCAGLRERAGIAEDFHEDPARAVEGVKRIIHALEELMNMGRKAFLLWAI